MRRPVPSTAVFVLAVLGSTTLVGNVFAQTPEVPTACARPPITCPTPIATATYLRINLAPDGDVCRFDPRTIDDMFLRLEDDLNDDVLWEFCNACPVDMTVQLDDPTGDGPFDRFETFTPLPDASNQVTVTVPCYGYGDAEGINAQSRGFWKYFLRARPVGAIGTFPDEIDPRLEIDDPMFRRWAERILMVVIGLLIGFVMFRRRARTFA